MRIGELAQAAGIRTSAIRYYEDVGLLDVPPRISMRREYPQTALSRLQVIGAAKQAGFRIDEIRKFLSALKRKGPASQSWRLLAESKLKELDANIARMRNARRTLASAIDCSCAGEAERCKLVHGPQLPRMKNLKLPSERSRENRPRYAAG